MEVVQLSTHQAAWGASSVTEKIPRGQILITVLVGEEHFQATKQPLKYLLVKGSNLHNITFKQVIGFPFCRKKALNCLVALW